MHEDAGLLLILMAAIGVIVVQVVRLRVHALLALMLASFVVGAGAGMLPPHPAAMAITQLLGGDVGKVILYGLIVGLPTAVIAGPVWVALVCQRHAPATAQAPLAVPTPRTDGLSLPGRGLGHRGPGHDAAGFALGMNLPAPSIFFRRTA